MACQTVIVGVGAATSIGIGAWRNAAAVRASVCGFREHPYMIDTAGEPMRVARARWIDLDLRGAERLQALLAPALDEALHGARAYQRIGVALGLPPDRPGGPADLAERMRRWIEVRYGRRLGPVVCFSTGHAAGLQALDVAMQGLTSGSLDACLVAGVDSHLEPETLEWIEACDQLHGGGALNNAWGYVPGEAAGALCVATVSAEQAGGAGQLATVLSVGIGHETKLIKTDTVCIGEGLTTAFRTALDHLPDTLRVDNIVCDLNGEAYRADEYGFTCLRTKQHLREATDFVAPADCWGDVGAAGGPLHVLLALVACQKGYGRGPLSLVWASSESGERAAALLHAPLTPRD